MSQIEPGARDLSQLQPPPSVLRINRFVSDLSAGRALGPGGSSIGSGSVSFAQSVVSHAANPALSMSVAPAGVGAGPAGELAGSAAGPYGQAGPYGPYGAPAGAVQEPGASTPFGSRLLARYQIGIGEVNSFSMWLAKWHDARAEQISELNVEAESVGRVTRTAAQTTGPLAQPAATPYAPVTAPGAPPVPPLGAVPPQTPLGPVAGSPAPVSQLPQTTVGLGAQSLPEAPVAPPAPGRPDILTRAWQGAAPGEAPGMPPPVSRWPALFGALTRAAWAVNLGAAGLLAGAALPGLAAMALPLLAAAAAAKMASGPAQIGAPAGTTTLPPPELPFNLSRPPIPIVSQLGAAPTQPEQFAPQAPPDVTAPFVGAQGAPTSTGPSSTGSQATPPPPSPPSPGPPAPPSAAAPATTPPSSRAPSPADGYLPRTPYAHWELSQQAAQGLPAAGLPGVPSSPGPGTVAPGGCAVALAALSALLGGLIGRLAASGAAPAGTALGGGIPGSALTYGALPTGALALPPTGGLLRVGGIPSVLGQPFGYPALNTYAPPTTQIPAVQIPGLPTVGSVQLPAVQGQGMPTVGSVQLPAVEGQGMPTVGSVQLPAVQGQGMPTVGSVQLPAVQGQDMPTVGGSQVMTVGAATPAQTAPPRGVIGYPALSLAMLTPLIRQGMGQPGVTGHPPPGPPAGAPPVLAPHHAPESITPEMGQMTLVAPPITVASPDSARAGTGVSINWADLAGSLGNLDEGGIRHLADALPGAQLVYPALPDGAAPVSAVNVGLAPNLLGSLVDKSFGPAAAIHAGAMWRAGAGMRGRGASRPLPASIVPLGTPMTQDTPLLPGQGAAGALAEAGRGQAARGGALDFLGLPVRLAPSLGGRPDLANELALRGGAGTAAASRAVAPSLFSALQSRLFPGVSAIDAEPDLDAWEMAAPRFNLVSGSPALLLSPDARLRLPSASSPLPQMAISRPPESPTGFAPLDRIGVIAALLDTGGRGRLPTSPWTVTESGGALAGEGAFPASMSANRVWSSSRYRTTFGDFTPRVPHSRPDYGVDLPTFGSRDWPQLAETTYRDFEPIYTELPAVQHLLPEPVFTGGPAMPVVESLNGFHAPAITTSQSWYAPRRSFAFPLPQQIPPPRAPDGGPPMTIQRAQPSTGALTGSDASGSGEAPKAAQDRQPGGDVNMLANEVWGLLKRRLATDAERMGFRR